MATRIPEKILVNRLTKEQEQAIREYQHACDLLFVHSAIDTKPLVRQEADDNYTKAWHNLLKAGITPNQASVHQVIGGHYGID